MFWKEAGQRTAMHTRGSIHGRSRSIIRRHLWTSHESHGFYRHKKQEKYVMHTHFFDSTTLRGEPLFSGNNFSVFGFLTNAFREGFLFRGMSRREEQDRVNQKVHGLAGSKPLVVYEEGTEEVDISATREIAKQHRKGDVTGISTSRKLGIGMSFANYLPKTHLIYVLDRDNIPPTQQVMQDYEDDIGVLDSTGELQNYTHELELTVSGAHVSAIPMRITRDGLKFNIECNPFYVDRKILSKHLDKQYDKLLKSFYDVIYDIRRDTVEFSIIEEPNPEKLKKFKAQEREFYTGLVDEIELDPRQKKAIKEKLSTYELEEAHEKGEEMTPKTL